MVIRWRRLIIGRHQYSKHNYFCRMQKLKLLVSRCWFYLCLIIAAAADYSRVRATHSYRHILCKSIDRWWWCAMDYWSMMMSCDAILMKKWKNIVCFQFSTSRSSKFSALCGSEILLPTYLLRRRHNLFVSYVMWRIRCPTTWNGRRCRMRSWG